MMYGQQQLPFMQAPDGGTYGQSGGNMRPDGNGGWSNGYQQQMSPNQQLASTAGSMSRSFYTPFNSPYGGMRDPNTYDRMPMQQGPMQMSPGKMGGGNPWAMPPQGYSRPGMDAQLGQPQGGLNPQMLAGINDLRNIGSGYGQPPTPQVGQWSSQAQAPQLPFSPVRNEGYGQAPMPMTNQYTAQNQTRGMSGGMAMGRPQRGGQLGSTLDLSQLNIPPPPPGGGFY